MKLSFLPLLALAVALVLPVGVDADDLVVNGDFAAGDLAGWVPPLGGLSAPSVGAQNGSLAVELSAPGAVAEIRQSFPASAGVEYKFNGFMLTENQLPAGATLGLLKIVFRDTNGTDLEPAAITSGNAAPPDVPGIESQPFLNDSSPVNTWIMSDAAGVAPTGTVEVLFLLLNVDFAGGANPMWFDNFSACEVGGSELLTNGDFEAGDLTGWSGGANAGDNETIGAPAVGAQADNFAAELELAAGVSELRQTFPAAPGEEFSMSGYMLTEGPLPSEPSFGLLKIVFQDANGADLAPASINIGQPNADFPGVESLPFLNDASPVDTWVFTEAQGVAPAGTVQVVFLVLNVDFGAGGPFPIWFDTITGCKVVDGGSVPPATLTVFRGITGAGGLPEVLDSDDNRLLMNPGFTINNTEAPVWLIFDAAISGTPSSLVFDRESQAGTPGLSVTTEAFNWTTGAYVVVDVTDEAFAADTIVSVDLSANAPDYVESGTGNIRSRVGWRRTGFTINFPWEARVDQISWTFAN